jgi:hypothetical protein
VTNSLFPADYFHLLLPSLLFAFYLLSWFLVGRDPRIENVSPQYDAPPGVSPGVAHYIQTGGSDGTTLAAVAASMAAKGVLAIQPAGKEYRLELLDPRKAVSPDEAALVKSLFQVEVPVEPYVNARKPDASQPPAARDAAKHGAATSGPETGLGVREATSQAVINPALAPDITAHITAIQGAFRANLEGVYFRHNYIYPGIGILTTFAWGLGTALFLEASSSLFITFWLLMFTSIAGLVIGGYWTTQPARPTVRQRVGAFMLPLMFFVLPGTIIYFVALPENHGFVLALLLAVLVNSVFFVIMRAPTALGRTTLQQLAGLREFLARVEQDHLNRMNSPAERAELMNRFLPYAIALGVREGWGDTLAAAFSDKIVER